MKHPDTRYSGARLTDAAGGITTRVSVLEHGAVRAHALALTRSLRLRSHSPTGFEWGYAGSGPAQLALALLLDATGDSELSLRYYHRFKWERVACWVADGWRITAGEIAALVEGWEREADRVAAEPIAPFLVEGGGR